MGVVIQLPSESDKLFSYLGIVTYLNRIFIEHSCGYIQISGHNYIDRVVISHRCNGENSKVPAKPTSPLPPDLLKNLFSNSGPK